MIIEYRVICPCETGGQWNLGYRDQAEAESTFLAADPPKALYHVEWATPMEGTWTLLLRDPPGGRK